MKDTLFVTGCAGFIGSHYVENMLKKGFVVVGIDNLNDFYDPKLKLENLKEIELTAKKNNAIFEWVKGDICDEKTVNDIINKYKPVTIVHLAAMAGVRPSLSQPVHYANVNYSGTTNILECAQKNGIKNIVFASSSSVYGNNKEVPFKEEQNVDSPISHYAATKRSCEIACQTYYNLYQMNIACLRFFTVYGPRQRPDLAINKFTRLIDNNEQLSVYGDGSKKRDFTYIDDIIDGVVKATAWVSQAKTPVFDIFNLGESKTTNVNALIDLIEKALGKKAKVKYLENQPGDVEQTFANIDKAKKILNYEPKTDISEGIKRYVAWYLKKKKS